MRPCAYIVMLLEWSPRGRRSEQESGPGPGSAMIYGSIAFGVSDHNHSPFIVFLREFSFLAGARRPLHGDILRTGCPHFISR